MNKKANSWDMPFLFVATIMWVTFVNIHCNETQTEEIKMYIDSSFQHRAHLDTLYWNHLEQCDFVLKDENKVDTKN